MILLPGKVKESSAGIVFVTVLIFSLILSLLTVGIISLLVSHQRSGQDVIDQIKAEQLAVGTFYRYHQAQIDGAAITYPQETLDGKDFSFTVVNNGTTHPPSPVDVDQIRINVDY